MQSPSYTQADSPYENQWQLLTDIYAILDYRLYLLYKYHQWLGPGNNMQNMLGLVVTRTEFEHKLAEAAQTGLLSKLTDDERESLETNESYLELRISQTDAARIPLLTLFERFSPDSFGRRCIALAYAAYADKKYEKLFAYLQDDITKKLPTTALAAQLYAKGGDGLARMAASFAGDAAYLGLFDAEALAAGELSLKSAVLKYLADGRVPESAGMRMYAEGTGELFINKDVAEELDRSLDGDGRCAIIMLGESGAGKKYQVERLMERRGERCLFVSLPEKGAYERARDAVMLARLAGAYLCFYGLERLQNTEVLAYLAHTDFYGNRLFLLSEQRFTAPEGMISVTLELLPATPAEVLELFYGYTRGLEIADDVSLEEIAVKFRFSAGQVKNAVMQAKGLAELASAPINAALLHRCCYSQVTHKLGELAVKVTPRFSWDDVILPESQKRLMREACAHIRYKHKVYDTWGFDGKVSYGRGLSMLFAGPPGTGKTMSAQIIARELNMEMYKLQISQIVSKYIGETEKNLAQVFREAKKSNCILFFDECDALFGKRSEVKDAQDRHANIEVAYLLQQIEEHEGVCIMATNLLQNIDEAFMRRITFVVHFPFPDVPMRKKLFMAMPSKSTPLSEDIDWDFLAEKFPVAGGSIKNIVLNAAFLAAQEDEPLAMRQLVRAAVGELRKNEMVIVREDLCEYADYIDA